MLHQEGDGCFESLTFQKTQPGDSAKPTRHNEVSERMKKIPQQEHFLEIFVGVLILPAAADDDRWE